MFRHPAWAVSSYSSGPPAARAVGTKSTGGFHQQDASPCTRAKNYILCILAHPKESILPAPFTSPPPPLCYVTNFFLRLTKFITWLLGDCKLLLWNDPDWNLLSTQVEEDPVRSLETTNLFLLWDLSTLDENELLSTWLLTYIDTKVLYASASVSVVSIHENQN